MRTVISIRVNEGVRMTLIDDGEKTEWRFARPADEVNSIIPKRGSQEELDLLMSLTAEEKQGLLQAVGRVNTAYDLLLRGKALGGLNGIV